MDNNLKSSLTRIEAKLDSAIRAWKAKEAMQLPHCLTIKSAADQLGMPASTLRKLIDRRVIESFRLGRTRLVKISDLKKSMVRYPSKSEILDDDYPDP